MPSWHGGTRGGPMANWRASPCYLITFTHARVTKHLSNNAFNNGNAKNSNHIDGLLADPTNNAGF
eukprot:2095800-Lingulodinium_polyedra.AAC.1